MFDSKKLAHWLDSLQVETHFPKGAPSSLVELPRSPLDDKMDKYDLFVQGNFNRQYGTTEFPIYGPVPSDAVNYPSYMMQWSSMQGSGWASYSGMNHPAWQYDQNDLEQIQPVDTPHQKLKAKISKLSRAESVVVANPAPPVSDRSPDYTHTITAWRGWEFDGGMLEALGSSSRWEPKVAARATCVIGGGVKDAHAAPHFSCRCGYWSFKTRELLEESLERYANSVDVIGQVEIWGRVIECDNGYRSEFAYPKELWLLDEGMESLSWKYGVPVRKLG
jgi:hypothetical protein